MFWGSFTPKLYFLSSRPPKGTSLRRNTRFGPLFVVIGPTVWSGRDAKNTNKKEPKVSQNSPFSQTLFPSSHINQILQAGWYPRCIFWFWVSERSVEKFGSSGGILGFPIDLTYRLYNSLLLSHKPWAYGIDLVIIFGFVFGLSVHDILY